MFEINYINLRMMKCFHSYMQNYWVRTVGPEMFSVFRQGHRTNNALEGFHSRLVRELGPHPGVWKFYGKILSHTL